MTDFNKWFAEKLIVARYPVLQEIMLGGIYAGIDLFINVSDQYYLPFVMKLALMGKATNYFPMGERSSDIGLSSLYGALQVLYQAYTENYSVLLHCQAGMNRSPTVRCAFYYMMTGEHIPEITNSFDIIIQSNRLADNAGEHLPTLEWLEAWLKKCRFAFENPGKFLGGQYDYCISKTNKLFN